MNINCFQFLWSPKHVYNCQYYARTILIFYYFKHSLQKKIKATLHIPFNLIVPSFSIMKKTRGWCTNSCTGGGSSQPAPMGADRAGPVKGRGHGSLTGWPCPWSSRGEEGPPPYQAGWPAAVHVITTGRSSCSGVLVAWLLYTSISFCVTVKLWNLCLKETCRLSLVHSCLSFSTGKTESERLTCLRSY